MGTWETNAKYHKEFVKLKTLTPHLNRHLYDLRWKLGFGKITFEEYTKRKKEIENDH